MTTPQTAKPQAAEGVTLLKELLFDRERRRLDDLSRRVEDEHSATSARHKSLSDRLDLVFERAGTEESLLQSVAVIIDGALREAEIARHEPLSRAIAPLIVHTIKVQLRESQDEMVDALYPITGRLVKSYVQAEINKRMIEINARLGGGRPSAAMLEKSDATGVSLGDLALADANKLEIQEVFLVRRGSGDLIAHWEKPEPASTAPAAGRQGGSNRDVLISGYISGIMTFSEEAFGAAPGSFRTLELENGDRIFVRGSAAHLLAVRSRGSAGGGVEQMIDEVFLDTLERYQNILTGDAARRRRADGTPSGTAADRAQTNAEIAAILPGLGRSIEALTAERQAGLAAQATAQLSAPSFGRLYALAALLAAPFVIWAAWSAYQSFETVRTESAANRVLQTTDEISGVPPRIEVARGGRALTVSGFVPTATLRDQIITRLGQEVPQASVRNQLAVLPKGTADVEAAMTDLRNATERQQLQATEQAIARALARVRPRLQAALDRIAEQPSMPDGTVSPDMAAVQAALVTALENAQQLAKQAAPERGQLESLWQRLNRADALLSSAMRTPTSTHRPIEVPSADRLQLAEDSSLIAERLAAVADTVAVPSTLRNLGARIDRLRAPTPREELDTFVRSNAIFFDNGAELRNARQADILLDRLAKQLRDNTDVLLRVVGYTDERGGQALNTNLAQTRAERVVSMLTDRGIAATRLVAVGRLTAKELSRNVGAGSANRRVEFEIGFPGESEGTAR